MTLIKQIKGINGFFFDLSKALEKSRLPEALVKSLSWGDILQATGEAVSEAVAPIRFITTLYENSTRIDDPHELGGIACSIAFQRSVQQSLNDVAILKIVSEKPHKFEWDGNEEERNYDFTGFTYETSLTHPFFKDAEAQLRGFCNALGLNESTSNNVCVATGRRFVQNLQQMLTHRETAEKFGPFLSLMDQRGGSFSAREALAQHAAYQRWLYEEKRVLRFEPFALQHIYVDTDCGKLTWGEISKGREQGTLNPFQEEHGGRQPLLDTVCELISDKNFKEAIIIQGLAGTGKSSFTLRLCKELLDKGIQPIRVEFKHVDTDRSLADALPQAVRIGEAEFDEELDKFVFDDDLFLGGEIFTETIEVGGVKMAKYALILDAWDEISIGAREGYQQQVEEFLGDIRRDFLSGTRACPVPVVLAGRPSDAVHASRFLRDDSMILTIRPFTPTQLREFVDLLGSALVMRPTKPDPGWEEWNLDDVEKTGKLVSHFESSVQSGRGGSLEILGLPLLAQLAMRLLAGWERDIEEILRNPTSLYRNLIDLLMGGAKPPETAAETEGKAHLRGDPLRELLRNTAEAMTAIGQEKISRDELVERLNLEGGELEIETEKLDTEQVLSRLMISFFFRGGHPELGCEFSHKSFREYLFAEQIVEELKNFGTGAGDFDEKKRANYWKDFAEDDPRYEFARRLANLLSPNWLMPEVKTHIRELLKWEIGRSRSVDDVEETDRSTEKLSVAQWCRIRQGLADLWDWWGEGVHLRAQPYKDRQARTLMFTIPAAVEIAQTVRLLSNSNKPEAIVPIRAITIDGHLGDALIELCSAVHWELRGESNSCVQRRYQTDNLGFSPSGEDSGFFRNYICRINSVGYRPEGEFPAHADLSGTDLRGATLNGTILTGANVKLVCLRLADLRGADLRGADLRGADLIGATLFGATLRGADLRGATLTGATLTGADLRGATLTGATLTGADLRGADLSEADLFGANLSGAKLSSGTKLSGAIGVENLRVVEGRVAESE